MQAAVTKKDTNTPPPQVSGAGASLQGKIAPSQKPLTQAIDRTLEEFIRDYESAAPDQSISRTLDEANLDRFIWNYESAAPGQSINYTLDGANAEELQRHEEHTANIRKQEHAKPWLIHIRPRLSAAALERLTYLDAESSTTVYIQLKGINKKCSSGRTVKNDQTLQKTKEFLEDDALHKTLNITASAVEGRPNMIKITGRVAEIGPAIEEHAKAVGTTERDLAKNMSHIMRESKAATWYVGR